MGIWDNLTIPNYLAVSKNECVCVYNGCVDVEKTQSDEVMERRGEEGWRSMEEGRRGWADQRTEGEIQDHYYTVWHHQGFSLGPERLMGVSLSLFLSLSLSLYLSLTHTQTHTHTHNHIQNAHYMYRYEFMHASALRAVQHVNTHVQKLCTQTAELPCPIQ